MLYLYCIQFMELYSCPYYFLFLLLILSCFIFKKRMCKAHSRAERGRLRQTTSLRECASSARSAFFVIGNSIEISYYKKKLPCEWHRTAVSSVVLIKLLYICCKFSQKTFRTMHRTHYEKPGKIQPPEVLRS